MDIIVTDVIPNGAQDVVDSGVQGEVYVLPSRIVDTPLAVEQAAVDTGGPYKAKARELVLSPGEPVRRLNKLSASFYADTKDGVATGASACDIGMLVEISAVCANKRDDYPNAFMDASRVTCLEDKVPLPRDVPKRMIDVAKRHNMQQQSVFACSTVLEGLFDAGSNGLNPAQKDQVDVCRSMWTRAASACIERLAVMQQGKDEDVASTLAGHETHIRKTPLEKLASGDEPLLPVTKYDNMIAPVVQEGIAPWYREPRLITLLKDTDVPLADIPAQFTAPWVQDLEIDGNLLSLDVRMAYVYATDLARQGIADGHTPYLASSTGALAISLSMKDFAHKFGTQVASKVTMGCHELLKVADFAAFPKVLKAEVAGVKSIYSDFPEGGTLYIDMQKTLCKAAVLVSSEFVKQALCGGGTTFVPPKISKTVATFELPKGVSGMPFLEDYGYQEVTDESFSLENWAGLGEIQFRVVYPGILADLTAEGTGAPCADSTKGEALLRAAAANENIKTYLTSQCLVYAVLA